MTGMTGDTASAERHARTAAWLVLIGAGVTTMSFNIWHAIHTGMPLGLALLYGIAPVSLAMGLSHIVAAHKGGNFMKAVTFLVMVAAMVMSIGATSEVIKSAAGPELRWVFGAVIDAAALVALQVILSPESRAAAKAVRNATASAAPEAMPDAAASATPEPSEEPAEEPAGEPSQRPRRAIAAISKEPDAEKARAAYRKSLRAGAPLSDRALGEMFSRSRTWGKSRIAEVDAGPALTAQAL